jgi:hypothetical protein
MRRGKGLKTKRRGGGGGETINLQLCLENWYEYKHSGLNTYSSFYIDTTQHGQWACIVAVHRVDGEGVCKHSVGVHVVDMHSCACTAMKG